MTPSVYHLRRLRQIRRRAGSEVTVRLVQAFIISRLDYCNSVLASLPESTIQPLQHVQNAAARLIFGLRTSDHITASLIQLHWLSIRWRIQCTPYTAADHPCIWQTVADPGGRGAMPPPRRWGHKNFCTPFARFTDANPPLYDCFNNSNK